MVFVSAEFVPAGRDGREQLVTVGLPMTPVSIPMTEKFVQGMENVSAVLAFARSPMRAGILGDTAKSAQLVRDVAMNSRTVFSVRCTRRGQWEMTRISVRRIAHSSRPSRRKL